MYMLQSIFKKIVSLPLPVKGGIVLVGFAALVSYGIIVSVAPTSALCWPGPEGEPGSCNISPCYYSEGPNPNTECRKYCGDGLIQSSFGERCDPGEPGGSTPFCTSRCQPPPSVSHTICENSACVSVPGVGTNQCITADDCGSDPNAYTNITVTANTPEARWGLTCPTGIPTYTCNGLSGSGEYWTCPGPAGGGCGKDTIAGKGNYRINPRAETANYRLVRVEGDANPYNRSARPPASVNVEWNLVYELKNPAPTDPSSPTLTGAPSCSATSYSGTLSWTGTPAAWGFKVELDDDFAFGSPSQKTVASGNTTAAPAGFAPAISFQPNVVYYARVTGAAGTSPIASWSVPTCAQGGTHNGCVNNACTTVQGAGPDECTTDLNCGANPTHNTCQGNACTSVAGTGTDSCSSNQNCGAAPVHNACSAGNQCTQVPGVGLDLCTTNAQCGGTANPSCTLTAAPNRIVVPPPGTAALTWECRDVTNCTIDNGVGPVAISGSTNVSPSQTTTYKVSCDGASASASVDIRVFTLDGGSLKEVRP